MGSFSYRSVAVSRMVGGVVKWNLIIRDGTGRTGTLSDSSPVVGQWYSVELHWRSDSVNGVGELYVNDLLVCSVYGVDTAAYGDVTQVWYGLPDVYNCDATAIYVDAFTLSSQPIGE